MDLITPDFGLFFWQTIVMLILIFLMSKYAWKPILQGIRKREQNINEALDSAENAKKEMQNLKADNERLLQEARLERDNMIKEARAIKDQIIAEAKQDAQTEADKLIEQARATIQVERNAAMADIKNQVATLSVQIAEKVLRQELSSDSKQQKLMEDMIEDVTLN